MKYDNEQEGNSSRMDDLFFSLFGFYPKKAGMAYEMLVGAILKIIGYNKVVLNESKRGNFDGNFYQIVKI